MNRHFIACEFGETGGRVVLGTLHRDQLSLSEVRRFANAPVREKDGLLWDVARLYHEMLTGLTEVGALEEPVDSLSASGWAGDYVLFEADGTLLSPTYHYADARTAAGRREVLDKVSTEELFAETGMGDSPRSTLYQLAAENARRLKRADHLLPVPDGFNFVLSGVPCVERSTAGATQLFSPETGGWSQRLPLALWLPPKLLPPVIRAGARIKALRPELAAVTRLEGAQVVASCSHDLAATLAGLPVEENETWAALRIGGTTALATELAGPLISLPGNAPPLHRLQGPHGTIFAHAETLGAGLLDECRAHWAKADYALDDGVLAYLASTADPLESVVNLADDRFATPGDLVAKLQAYCRETGQPVPRKPGSVTRCLLESLAFLYRWRLDQLAQATGREFTRIYLVSDTANSLLHHFIANALQRPVVIASNQSAAIGNLVVQMLALGRVKSLPDARAMVRRSFKTVTVHPHPAPIWAAAYDRLLELAGVRVPVPLNRGEPEPALA
jgi:rhamnulokinase